MTSDASDSHNGNGGRNRPFPWKCPACGENRVNPAVVPYRSEVNHDGRIHEVVVPDLQVPRCESCGELIFNERAEKQISDSLRALLGIMQPAAIRTERERLGLDQLQLALQLGVADSSLARWNPAT